MANSNKKKQEIVKILKNTYCRLKPSKISGIGVFAIRDIPKNKNPFIGSKDQKWIRFKLDELKNIDDEIMKMIDDFFVIEKNGFVDIPENGLNGIDISFFLNNFKNPNLKIVYKKNEDSASFITTKKIKKGEELTIQYSTYDEKYK